MPVALGGVGFAEGVTADVAVRGPAHRRAERVAPGRRWQATSLIKITQMLVGLRVDPEIETQGLDLSTHGETGYNVAFGGTSK